jgi:cytochrome P450
MNDSIPHFFSPQMIENPHPVFALLRANAPVAKVGPTGEWVVTRYEDIVNVLKNPEIFSSSTDFIEFRKMVEGERLALEAPPNELGMVMTDPPDHTRLRKLVSGVFTPRSIARLEDRVKQITGDLIDQILKKDAFDVMEDLAIPLPVTVIAEVLGIDPARRADFKRWSDDTISIESVGIPQTEEQIERLIQSRRAFIAFFRGMIEDRRASPRDDLISDLVRAEVESDKLTADEVFSMLTLLLIAGNETTTNLIGNGVHLLLEHPEVERKLREDPSRIPAFIEEVLRFESPVTLVVRKPIRDVTIAGVAVPKDDRILCILASGNRDSAQFPDPDRFDIDREARGHLTFGHGIHFCVGAPLSRLEGAIAFEQILRRLPPFVRVEAKPRWNTSFNLHGLKALPVRFRRAEGVVSAP